MAKFYVSGDTTDACTVHLYTTNHNNYIGYLDVPSVGAYELVFELDSIENVDIWSRRSDGYYKAYGNITPIDGTGKTVNITYEFTEVYGGNASTY
jgi:hypothetical protein